MKTLYLPCTGFAYKDGIFSAGLVKNSIHRSDKIYLRINDNIFELRSDEAYAIISALGSALWTDYQSPKQDKVKLKWKTLEQIIKKRR
uniref:Uncharacterized protein n=1 Tax=viral metagenome TaxID=1070528 RepID=A0A6M3XQL8_9ZZZZ